MPASYRFRPIVRGDTATLAVFLRRGDVRSQQRTPFPLTGADVEWTIRPPGLPDEVFARASGLTIDDANGGISLPLSPTESAAFPLGDIPFRIRIKDRDGVVTTVLVGVIPTKDWPMKDVVQASRLGEASVDATGSVAPIETVEVVLDYNSGTVDEAVRAASELIQDKVSFSDLTEAVRQIRASALSNALIYG